jgi:hypothetical protein
LGVTRRNYDRERAARFLGGFSAPLQKPGSTLQGLLSEQDPALLALSAREQTRRVRDLSAAGLQELDF